MGFKSSENVKKRWSEKTLRKRCGDEKKREKNVGPEKKKKHISNAQKTLWTFPEPNKPDAICCYEFTTKHCKVCAGDGWHCGPRGDGHCHPNSNYSRSANKTELA